MDAALILTHWFVVACFPLAMAYAAFCDIRTLIIPNWISAAAAALFVPAAMLAGLGFQDIAAHYGTGALLFIIGAVFFAFKILGGGDVKLLAASSVWIGWEDLAPFLIVIAVLGGLLALFVMAFRRIGWIPPFLLSLPWLSAQTGKGQPIPYGVAISLAAILGVHRLSVLPGPLY